MLLWLVGTVVGAVVGAVVDIVVGPVVGVVVWLLWLWLVLCGWSCRVGLVGLVLWLYCGWFVVGWLLVVEWLLVGIVFGAVVVCWLLFVVGCWLLGWVVVLLDCGLCF